VLFAGTARSSCQFNAVAVANGLPLVFGSIWPDKRQRLFTARLMCSVHTRSGGDTVGATPMDRPESGRGDPNMATSNFTLTTTAGACR